LSNMLLATLLSTLDSNTSKETPYLQTNEFITQKNWAAVIELLHMSSLMHDDVIDNATSRRGLISVNHKYGSYGACFGANFIVGRCVQKIGEFNNIHMFQVYGKIMDDLTSGEYIQARKNKNFDDFDRILKDYIIKSYYKTGSLISNSLRGVAILHRESLEVQTQAFLFGQHLGIAFQLIDDILDYTKSSKVLGKEALSDLKEGVLTGPVYFCLNELKRDNHTEKYDEFLELISNHENLEAEDLQTAAELIKSTSGIEMTKHLANLHTLEALRCIDRIIKIKSIKPTEAYTASLSDLKRLIFHVILREN